MARGETIQATIHLKGKADDYIVFCESAEQYKKWLSDKSVPLTQVVSSFKIFCTHRRGAQGPYDGASQAALENEFGTSVDEEVVKQILEKGTLKESQMEERSGNTNASIGSLGGHF